MAAAADFLEQLMYRAITEEGFANVIVNTASSIIVLYNGIPKEDGSGGVEFGVDLTGPSVTGYSAFSMYNGSSDTFEPVAGKTGIWFNIQELNFGNNGHVSPWPSIVGWGIKDPAIGPPNLYLKGAFLDEFGNPTSFVVDPGKDFIIPVGSFLLEIR